MTDYERDYSSWKHDQSKARDFESAPDPSDYDENGYKKDSKNRPVRDGSLELDPYLIETYGIEYARQNPLRRI